MKADSVLDSDGLVRFNLFVLMVHMFVSYMDPALMGTLLTS